MPDLIAEAAEILGLHREVRYIHGPLMHGGSNKECWVDEQGGIHSTIADFDPLNNIAHAWLLVEKMREMPPAIRVDFGLALQAEWVSAGQDATFTELTWLTPRAITTAAVEAVRKEKG